MRPSLYHPTLYAVVIAAGIIVLASGVVLALRSKKVALRAQVLPRPVVAKPLQPLPPGAERTVAPPHEPRGRCHSCHPVAGSRSPAAMGGQGLAQPVPAAAQERGAMMAGAGVAMGAGVVADILSPADQNAASKALFEGHWLGMEVMDLSVALRGIYKVPVDVMGVIVDEITLESTESGILAGDVITDVNGWRTATLSEFLQATMRVSGERKADVTVFRLGANQRFILVAKNSPILGFAQMEGASPIQPGALSPHRNRREACTACHVFMTTGGQLPTDAGDILPSPPPIAANARAAHAYRGVCNACHQILR